MLGLAALALVLGAWGGVRVYRFVRRDSHPPRGPVPLPSPVPPGLEAVSFPSRDGTRLAGWLLPPKNGGAVVLIHGTHSDRRSLLPEAVMLSRHGYGALVFDLPGRGESGGEVHWSEEARDAIRGALAYLAALPGVKPGHVAAYGFSMGGRMLAEIAPGEPRLGAIVFAATPVGHGALGRALGRAQEPAFSSLHEVRVPTLVITGEHDGTVPPERARALAGALGGPATCVILPRSRHGYYTETDPELLESTVVDFLDRALSAAGARPSAPPSPSSSR